MTHRVSFVVMQTKTPHNRNSWLRSLRVSRFLEFGNERFAILLAGSSGNLTLPLLHWALKSNVVDGDPCRQTNCYSGRLELLPNSASGDSPGASTKFRSRKSEAASASRRCSPAPRYPA